MSERIATETAEIRDIETNAGLHIHPTIDESFSLLIEALRKHPLVEEAFTRIRAELPGDLIYHTEDHTKDVFDNVIRLALRDRLSEHDITLLAIASAWHYVGFIARRAGNEVVAAEWVRKAMLREGYDEEDIRDVTAAILDTQLKMNAADGVLEQQVHGRLSPWLLDSDLANFGSPDFFEKTVLVYNETSGWRADSVADLVDEEGLKYLSSTMSLMLHHSWHTTAARDLFTRRKEKNLNILAAILRETPQLAC